MLNAAGAAGAAGAAVEPALEWLKRVLVSQGAAAVPPRRGAPLTPGCPAFHFAVETALLAAIILLLFRRSFKPEKKPLTEKVRVAPARGPTARQPAAHSTSQEIDTLCAEWQPEPLVPPLSAEQRAFAPPVLVGCALLGSCGGGAARGR